MGRQSRQWAPRGMRIEEKGKWDVCLCAWSAGCEGLGALSMNDAEFATLLGCRMLNSHHKNAACCISSVNCLAHNHSPMLTSELTACADIGNFKGCHVTIPLTVL